MGITLTKNTPQPRSVAVQHPDLDIDFSITDMPGGKNITLSLPGIPLTDDQRFALQQMLGVWKYGMVTSEE